jgi:electron transport complex protein RnfD
MEATKKEHELIVSVSPHIRSEESVKKIMWTVNFSLLPATVMGLYFFGPRALWVTVITILAALGSEALVQKMAGRKVSLSDGSAFLTGLLLALNLPPSAPIYIPIMGAFVAVAITKQLFGGLGYNIFNPALIGRAFVLITWPRAMTTWSAPDSAFTGMDAVTTATPLGILKEDGLNELLAVFGDKMNLYYELFLGHRAGSLGETSVIALLIGAGYLLYKRYITWQIPVSFIATVGIVAWIFGGSDPETGKFAIFAGDPLFHMMSGGLMLGAFFMATDYVTAPSVRHGQIVFGVGCGLITMLIRIKGGFPEGVMFGILLMNCFAPLIDRSMKSRTFGLREPEKEKKE